MRFATIATALVAALTSVNAQAIDQAYIAVRPFLLASSSEIEIEPVAVDIIIHTFRTNRDPSLPDVLTANHHRFDRCQPDFVGRCRSERRQYDRGCRALGPVAGKQQDFAR